MAYSAFCHSYFQAQLECGAALIGLVHVGALTSAARIVCLRRASILFCIWAFNTAGSGGGGGNRTGARRPIRPRCSSVMLLTDFNAFWAEPDLPPTFWAVSV